MNSSPEILSYPSFYMFYVVAVGSAVFLFLIIYIRNLILRAKKGDVGNSPSLPVWLNLMYPSWLDELSFKHIFQAFAWALGSATVLWLILAILALIVIMKV